jgi:hypothetical protein
MDKFSYTGFFAPRGNLTTLSIEVEPWRSEGISAKCFIVMFGARHDD